MNTEKKQDEYNKIQDGQNKGIACPRCGAPQGHYANCPCISKEQFERDKKANTVYATPFDLVGSIMEFEGGMQDEEKTVELFQHLVDTGMAWTLQGAYGRTAMAMIQAGMIHTRAN